MALFSRKSADVIDPGRVDGEPVTDELAEPAPPRGYTPKKGEPTPKRAPVGRRPAAAPANRKEALARSREKARQDRAEARAGMMAGDPRYLTARDRGPARKLVRDIVDSRRGVGALLIPVVVVIMMASFVSVQTQIIANLMFLFMLLLVVADAVVLTRRIKKLVTERLPKNTERMGSLYWYGVMRSLSMRRLRMPRPQVGPGERI